MIVLDVIGLPAPQGSKTVMRGYAVEGSSETGRANLKEWRRAVADAARRYLETSPRAPLAEALYLVVEFRFPLPASDRHRWRHTTKPDLSKLIRSTEDALVHGGLLKDDSCVWKLDIEKRYAHGDETVGALIKIQPHGLAESQFRDDSKRQAAVERKAARRAS